MYFTPKLIRTSLHLRGSEIYKLCFRFVCTCLHQGYVLSLGAGGSDTQPLCIAVILILLCEWLLIAMHLG